MALAILELRAFENGSVRFRIDTGTNTYYRVKVGRGVRRDSGIDWVDEVTFSTPVRSNEAGGGLLNSSKEIAVPASRFGNGHAYVQLFSFKTPEGRSPAFSRVLKVPAGARIDAPDDFGVPPLSLSTAMTRTSAFHEPRIIRCRTGAEVFAREASWGAVLSQASKIVTPAAIRLLEASAARGARPVVLIRPHSSSYALALALDNRFRNGRHVTLSRVELSRPLFFAYDDAVIGVVLAALAEVGAAVAPIAAMVAPIVAEVGAVAAPIVAEVGALAAPIVAEVGALAAPIFGEVGAVALPALEGLLGPAAMEALGGFGALMGEGGLGSIGTLLGEGGLGSLTSLFGEGGLGSLGSLLGEGGLGSLLGDGGLGTLLGDGGLGSLLSDSGIGQFLKPVMDNLGPLKDGLKPIQDLLGQVPGGGSGIKLPTSATGGGGSGVKLLPGSTGGGGAAPRSGAPAASGAPGQGGSIDMKALAELIKPVAEALPQVMNPLIELVPQLMNATTQRRLQLKQANNKLITDLLSETNRRRLLEQGVDLRHLAPAPSTSQSLMVAPRRSLPLSSRAILSFVTADPVQWNGQRTLLFSRTQPLQLKVKLTVGAPVPTRPLPKATLKIVFKNGVDQSVWFEKTFRRTNLAANVPISVAFSQDEIATLPANREVTVLAELRWQTPDGIRKALGSSEIVLVNRYFLAGQGEAASERELTDMTRFKPFWHKVWQSPGLDSGAVRGGQKYLWELNVNAKYTVLLSPDHDANGLMETRIARGAPDPDSVTETVEGRMKSGIELSMQELNRLLPLWDAQPLEADVLDALLTPAFARRNAGEFTYNLALKGKARERGLVWVVPVFKLFALTLGGVQRVDDAGQVLAVGEQQVRFPLPVSARVIGLKSLQQ